LVREAKIDGLIPVTKMHNARVVAKRELARLYVNRWHIELDIRNIQTDLGIEVLRCLTPAMVEKELWVCLLPQILIGLLMVQAGHNAAVDPRELSFKHTMQTWSTWVCSAEPEELFQLVAQRSVGNRPGRSEPRVRKRRRPLP